MQLAYRKTSHENKLLKHQVDGCWMNEFMVNDIYKKYGRTKYD